jgi:hypothetical protein
MHTWIYPPPTPGADDPADIDIGNPPWLVVTKYGDENYDVSYYPDYESARKAVEKALLRAEVSAQKIK